MNDRAQPSRRLASLVERARCRVYRRMESTWIVRRLDRTIVRRVGLAALVRHTGLFRDTTWLGRPVWQNLADLWLLQELIVERDVDLVVECGTNRGGSAFFMASLFDLLGRGRVVTVDVDDLMAFSHPRIRFLRGSSTDSAIVETIRDAITEDRAREVLVLLDSDHSAEHVLAELRAFANLVPVGGYVLVQDGAVDELPRWRTERPGPLPAIRQFLAEDERFEIDEARSGKYLFHVSPNGCLRRIR